MKKKAIAVLVTGVMVMASMTACGADTKEAEPVAAMTEETAEEPVEETAEEPAAEETTEEAAEETTEEAAETENEATEEAAEEETEEETAENDIYEGLEYDADADAYYYTVVDTEGVTLKSVLIPAGLKDDRIASTKDSEAKILDTEYVIEGYESNVWGSDSNILAVDLVQFADGSKEAALIIEKDGSLVYGDYVIFTDDELNRIFDTDSNMMGFMAPVEGDSAETCQYFVSGYSL